MVLQLIQSYTPILIEGFQNTLMASIIALIFSTIIGTFMAMVQVSQSKVLRGLATAYVEFFRNIPLLVIVMFFYVVVPMYWFSITGFQAGVIGLTIYTSSFIADNVRAGILSIDKGQTEAGLSQGLTYWQTMWYIVLPQAIRVVIPPLGNQFINLVKNSSVLAMVAGLDIMYYGDLIASETFITVDTYIVVALFYLLITIPLTFGVRKLEDVLGVKEGR